MAVLLDTHILLSNLGLSDIVLPLSIRELLNQKTRVCVSVATLWEFAIKHRLGKIGLSISLNEMPNVLGRMDIQLLPVEAAHVLADIGPEPGNKDPFDRLLLGVCAAENLKLVTIDRVLTNHPLAWREALTTKEVS